MAGWPVSACRRGPVTERPGTAPAAEPLERVRIGNTSVSVTRFVLGCAPLAGLYAQVEDEEAVSTLEEAWRLGVRAFDTAPHYGAGRSERRLGAFLAGVPREDFVLSTKVGRLLVDDRENARPTPEFAGEDPIVRVRDYSASGVRRSLEGSLDRLGLDRIDIALVHDAEDHLDAALDGAFPALAELRDAGVIGAVGAGMNLCDPLCRVVEEADVDCILVAGRYSLLDQQAAISLLSRCAERGVSVLAAGVFNGEVLANPQKGAHFDYSPASEEVIARALAIREVCERYDVALAAAAVRFPFRHPAVSAVVVGARSAGEVQQDVQHYHAEVPEALFDELAELGVDPTGQG